MVKRFDIFLLNLDPEISSEPKNSRPCVVISPDEVNRNVDSIIVAPIASLEDEYPTRVNFEFLEKQRAIVLDQIRTVERARLAKKIGNVRGPAQKEVLRILREMFAE